MRPYIGYEVGPNKQTKTKENLHSLVGLIEREKGSAAAEAD